jgi:hypothetical protein
LIAEQNRSSPKSRVRIHFHGWSQTSTGQPQNPVYDFSWPNKNQDPKIADVKKMALAYGMDTDACSEPLIMPLSRGHDDDYKSYFKTPEAFDTYIESLQTSVQSLIDEETTFTLSAHSGGGKILSLILSPRNTRVETVKLLDGTYDTDTPRALNQWLGVSIQHFYKSLEAHSVTTATRHYSTLFELSGSAHPAGPGTLYETDHAELFKEIRSDNRFDHYSIVKARWKKKTWRKSI